MFLTTRWSVVLSARGEGARDSGEALESLCAGYWYPLYVYVRRQGRSPEDAQDLTQGFFARLLEKRWLEAADREKGKFRSFLLTALKRYLANEWDHARTLKRGGGVVHVPMDTQVAESRYVVEPVLAGGAEELYERRWAMTLLEQAMAGLRAEYEAEEKGAEFELLKGTLGAARGEVAYERLALELGMTESGARGAVHRIRKTFREAFRAAVAGTVGTAGDVDGEMRYLAGVLGRAG